MQPFVKENKKIFMYLIWVKNNNNNKTAQENMERET